VHESHWLAIKHRPFLWAKFVMTMFDFAADWRGEGGAPGMNDKGLVTHDHKTRKDAFYWYKANWNDWDPFVYITSRRFDVRTKQKVRVKVYSNLVKVELKCNGVTWGVKESEDHIFLWPEVLLSEGRNTLTARSETAKEIIVDEVVWTLRPQDGQQTKG
jgi:beta-galactosidase